MALFSCASDVPPWRTEFDLFESFPPDVCSSRFAFASQLARIAPTWFDLIPSTLNDEATAMDSDHGAYLLHRSQSRQYACRHLVYLSSRETVRQLVPSSPPVTMHVAGDDSLHVVTCDTDQRAYGCVVAEDIELFQSLNPHEGELLSEMTLRSRFLKAVVARALGRPVTVASPDDFQEL